MIYENIWNTKKKLQGKHFSHPWNEYALYGRSLSITFLDLIMVIKIILYVVTGVWRSCFYWFVICRSSSSLFSLSELTDVWCDRVQKHLNQCASLNATYKCIFPKAALRSLSICKWNFNAVTVRPVEHYSAL